MKLTLLAFAMISAPASGTEISKQHFCSPGNIINSPFTNTESSIDVSITNPVVIKDTDWVYYQLKTLLHISNDDGVELFAITYASDINVLESCRHGLILKSGEGSAFRYSHGNTNAGVEFADGVFPHFLWPSDDEKKITSERGLYDMLDEFDILKESSSFNLDNYDGSNSTIASLFYGESIFQLNGESCVCNALLPDLIGNKRPYSGKIRQGGTASSIPLDLIPGIVMKKGSE